MPVPEPMPHHEDVDPFAEVIGDTVLAPPCDWAHHSHAVNCGQGEPAKYVLRTIPHRLADGSPMGPAVVLLVCEDRMIWLRSHWNLTVWRCQLCGGVRTIGEHFEALGPIDRFAP